MTLASAPAKLILCGEHAVVYQRPAIALPLGDIRAYARVADEETGRGIRFSAPDLNRTWSAADAPNETLSELARATLHAIGVAPADVHITLTADIPIASGMGSGAAIATALVRGLAAHFGRALPPADISALVYASERRFHGTPSGIDNTVVAYEQAIWFVRQAETATGAPPPVIEPIRVAAPFILVIGDTGRRSATRLPVGEVRRRWQADPAHYEDLFDQVGAIALQARAALADGAVGQLGALLNDNQRLLEQIGVSSPELEHLIAAARAAGAAGAKLSGAGWGGVMLALVDADARSRVGEALRQAGATRVLETVVGGDAGVEGVGGG